MYIYIYITTSFGDTSSLLPKRVSPIAFSCGNVHGKGSWHQTCSC